MKLIQTVKRRMGTDEQKKQRANSGSASDKGKSNATTAPRTQPAAKTANENQFAALPKLREAPLADRAELFRRKMQVCSTIFDFNDDSNQKDKEAKRQTLLEIVEYVNNTRNCFNESLMQDVVNMVGANIFRALPTKNKTVMAIYDPDDEEPSLERAWPHLQIVYEFFLRFVVSNDTDPKVAKRFVDQNFVLKLLELFDSEDPRERDYLKTILHRVYGKFMALRSFIRRAIQQTFFKVIYECELHNGVGELLEILGSIINGFALPLKDEHKEFLIKALIPLHKVKALASFHQQLSYCMAQYVEKDPRLAHDIIISMLKFWPVSITSKQVLFLNELEETLELTQPAEFHTMQQPLFRRIALCITCPHFQVAERTLFLWNNDYIVKLINQNRQAIFPILIGALYTNSKQHWNSAVHGLTFNVLKLLMEADAALFDECSAKHRIDSDLETEQQKERERKWKLLQDAFQAKKR
jgi:serine/threonine-protein phosphatase 2A regulatory subunit B'|mmetsp:Transcript_108462/g.171147  ORF Transcript_108462/g.171147 Transcript_108462/m.171147 type:complete len:469 (-) Transcript_108462:71-1477(-)|eukprot:CAMPEP_0169098060 /NCGR_PEP_ID=MMETSP1015-20121227/19838_1 /TAXON_ID=342587 /ORGANISM="Karlodinium micrum, Strain CCMP2283" /LENGTH=468 /DNA_ID=CAMNT_0009158881 /DNA_START=92 /DNA_END=1498 /DNA_ORIENTATION=+